MAEQYWRLVEQSPDAIFVSRDFRVTFLNPAAMRLCGASSPEDVLGRSLLDIVHSDSRALVRETIGRWMAGQDGPAVEARIAQPGAPIRYVEIAGAPLDAGDADHAGEGH